MRDLIVINQDQLVNRQAEWESLVNAFSSQTIFMQPGYLLPWLENFTTHQQRVLFGLENNRHGLVALLPFWWDGNQTLRIVGAVDLSDYLDIVVKPQEKSEIYPAIISFLKQNTGPWEKLVLESVPQTSATLIQFKALCEAEGWRVAVTQQTVCPVITLPKTWEEYLTSLEAKSQHQFRRLLKNIGAEDEISYRCVTKPEEIETQIDTFIGLHKMSGTSKQGFWTPEREVFFKQMAMNMAEKNWFKLYFLDVDGQPAASMVLFDYHHQILAYNSGFDAYRYGHLGVGNAIVLHSIKHAIEMGRTRYDFMRGEEPYKFAFGARAEPLFDMTVRR